MHLMMRTPCFGSTLHMRTACTKASRCVTSATGSTLEPCVAVIILTEYSAGRIVYSCAHTHKQPTQLCPFAGMSQIFRLFLHVTCHLLVSVSAVLAIRRGGLSRKLLCRKLGSQNAQYPNTVQPDNLHHSGFCLICNTTRHNASTNVDYTHTDSIQASCSAHAYVTMSWEHTLTLAN